MRRWTLTAIGILLLVGLGVCPALAQGPGEFQRDNCTVITNPQTYKTWCRDTTRGVLNVYDGTGYQSDVAVATGRVNVTDPRWGAKGDGTTDDTTAINAARAYAETLTLNPQHGDGLGSAGGACLYFPRGTYLVTTAILSGQANSQTREYCFEGDGPWDSVLVWGGGNTGSIISQGRPDLGNVNRFVVRRLGFTNKATSGSSVTAVRATGINGIALNATGATAGVNDVVIEECVFTYLSNALVNTTASAVNQLTFRKNLVRLGYNQTSPVVDPLTDALVTGRGNAMYFASGTIAQGIYLYDNDITNVQAWFLDSQGEITNLVAQGNFIQPSSFTLGKAVRLASFTSFVITGNQYQFPSGGGANKAFDLGTSALGSSNVSGGVFSSNYANGTNSAGQDMVVLTFADGVAIFGNSFFNTAGKAITLTGANVKNTFIGTNNYVTVTTKLSDGGALTSMILDPSLTMSVSSTLGVGTTSPTSVAGWSPFLHVKGTFGGVVLESTSTDGRSFSIGSNTGGGTGKLEFFDETAGASRGRIESTGGLVWGAPTGGDKGAGTINAAGAYYANGTVGQSATVTVRDAAGTGTCTLIFTNGLKTGGTC